MSKSAATRASLAALLTAAAAQICGACSSSDTSNDPASIISALCDRLVPLPCMGGMTKDGCLAQIGAERMYAKNAGCASQWDLLAKCMTAHPPVCDTATTGHDDPACDTASNAVNTCKSSIKDAGGDG